MTVSADLRDDQGFAKPGRYPGAPPPGSARSPKKGLESYKARLAIWLVGWLLLYALVDHIRPTVAEITSPPTSAVQLN